MLWYKLSCRLLEAAGEWEHALVVAGLADNGDAIRGTRENAESNLDAARLLELERFKKQLLEASRHSSGPAPLTKPDESLLGDNPRTWSLAPEGSVPEMETVQGETPSGLIRVGDIGRILPLDRKDIQGYMFGAAKMSRAGSVMSAMRFSSMSEISIAPTDGSLEVGETTLQVGGARDSDGEAGGQTGGIMHDFKDLIGNDGFSSSEDEGPGGDDRKELGNDDNASDLSRGGVFGKKFKIEIKSREDANSGASADVLRDAAKKLRMGGLGLGPSLGPGGFAQALKGAAGLTRQDSYSSVSSTGTALDVLSSGGGDYDHSRPPSLSTLYTGEAHSAFRSPGAPSPALPTKVLPPSASRTTSPGPLSPTILPLSAPAPPAATSWQQFDPFDPFSQPPAQTHPQEDASTSFTRGVTLMEGGKWPEAESAFSQAIGASGGSGDLANKAKQYLTAVLIMKYRSKCTPEVSAKLMRYAAALKLDSKHGMALRKSSITENIAVQNYGYAAGELTSLITASIGTVSPEVSIASV